MNIDVMQIKKPTFWDVNPEDSYVPASDRFDGERLDDYLSRLLKDKSDFIKNKIDYLLNIRKGLGDYMFITLPELYWNAPWDSLLNKDEIGELVEYYMNNLSEVLSNLTAALKPEKYGNIVLIPGSVALPVYIESDDCYESFNYILTTANWMKNEDGTYVISMWPKRYTSLVDYGVGTTSSREGYYTFNLGNAGFIDVLPESSVIAEHNSGGSYGPVFDNDYIPGCPFSINLCLDYDQVAVHGRDDEIADINSRIDFLISCGFTLSDSKKYPDSVSYAFRNDGAPQQPPDYPENYPVSCGYISGQMILPDTIENDIYLWSVDIDKRQFQETIRIFQSDTNAYLGVMILPNKKAVMISRTNPDEIINTYGSKFSFEWIITGDFNAGIYNKKSNTWLSMSPDNTSEINGVNCLAVVLSHRAVTPLDNICLYPLGNDGKNKVIGFNSNENPRENVLIMNKESDPDNNRAYFCYILNDKGVSSTNNAEEIENILLMHSLSSSFCIEKVTG